LTLIFLIEKGSVNISNSRLLILKFILRPPAARLIGFAIAFLMLAASVLLAQTVGTGSIVGIVTDPQGAVLSGVKVEIMNRATGAVIHVATSSAGA
jgi:hypothetical protein